MARVLLRVIPILARRGRGLENGPLESKISLKSVLFAAAIVATAGAAIQAKAVTVDTGDNQGWWSDFFPNNNGNDNYLTGNVDGGNYNSFFVFDLSGLSGKVTSATLRLDTAMISGGPLTFSLWDV